MIRILPAVALFLATACLPVGDAAVPTERDHGDHDFTPAVIHTDQGVHYQDESGRWHAIGKPHGNGYSGSIYGDDEAVDTAANDHVEAEADDQRP